MSTGADCFFIERAPRQWFYSIQEYPYGATEDYETHGQFDSFVLAQANLNRRYANPGGYTIEPHPDSDDKTWESA